MASRPAFSFVDMLITLAVIISILAMIPVRKNVKAKKYRDVAADYIDLKNKKVVQDVYGSHK